MPFPLRLSCSDVGRVCDPLWKESVADRPYKRADLNGNGTSCAPDDQCRVSESQLNEPRCEMERPMKEVPCSFCGGTGKDPFGIMSHLSTCCVCGGTGVVQVGAPYVRCAHCRGTGAIKTLTCTVCGGKGFVPSPVGPTATCPECQGTGDDASAPAMACLRCRGRGRVPVSRVKTDVK